MDSKVNSLEAVYHCIEEKQNFVLQGGAGSGKTESLKAVLEHISCKYPNSKVACITFTNLAADEIRSRVSNNYTICTIHSFLNEVIKRYKKNIHQLLPEIFKQEKVNSIEHKEYKKCYEKYASSLFTIKGEIALKVTGKREYDRNITQYNNELNCLIDNLNLHIEEEITKKDYNEVKYNETKFDNFKEISFGHDSLPYIAWMLFEKYPLLSKILQDKYDYIFIDEYQDTNEKVIDFVLNKVSKAGITLIGLFGDSMQGIYDDGIGDVNSYIESGLLTKVEKEDNYRCSKQVIDFINQIRNDGLKQEVALKKTNGKEETIQDRQGFVKLYYSVYNGEKTATGHPQDKEDYSNHLNCITQQVIAKYPDYIKLLLTNKSIAKKVGFESLFKVFDDRYSDVNEKLEKEMTRLQFLELAELSKAYSKNDFNFVITQLKRAGYQIKTAKDKTKINELLNALDNPETGAIEALENAFKNKLLKESESYSSYVNRKNVFLKEISEDTTYQVFKSTYNSGKNTFIKIQEELNTMTEDKFKEYEHTYKKERFYMNLFSKEIKFKEIANYFSYINEETEYITMHKTKGSGIKNVMVVLDEYFWNKYNFKLIFNPASEPLARLRNQKLFYVACSRSIENLICIRMTLPEDKENLLEHFNNHKELFYRNCKP